MRGLVAGTVQFGFLIGSLLFSLIFLFLLPLFLFHLFDRNLFHEQYRRYNHNRVENSPGLVLSI